MSTDHPDLATARAQLLADFGKVVGDTEALLRSLASEGGEKAAALRVSLQAQLENAKSRMRELQGAAAGMTREADAYVHENPWAAIGVAAGIGLIVGLMLGRRD
jgi:ElaB/YqjD/DUF883 family membrane-anchored ribosome-binding protein